LSNSIATMWIDLTLQLSIWSQCNNYLFIFIYKIGHFLLEGFWSIICTYGYGLNKQLIFY